MASFRYAEVVVDLTTKKLDKGFHYSIPAHLQQRVKPGVRVLVPFQNRSLEGYVMDLVEQPEVDKTRDILQVVDEEPVFSSVFLRLARWLAKKYACTLVEALQCVMPTGIKMEGKKLVALTGAGLDILAKDFVGDAPEGINSAELRALELLDDHGGEVEMGALVKEMGPRKANALIKGLKDKGLVETGTVFKAKIGKKTKTVVDVTFTPAEVNEKLAMIGPRAAKQAKTLTLAASSPGLTVTELAAAADTTSATVQALVQKGLLVLKEIEIRRDPYAERSFMPTVSMAPTPEQAAALGEVYQALEEGLPRTYLIHGVTGSGKTEIYLQSIAKVLAMGRQAIVLVPEISLTPQMVSRFKGRFGSKVAVLHSRLSLGERYDEWRRIKENQVQVVVGARSAVFAPFDRLGMIIIDEEHEGTYKQEDNPKYHAREVALMRARLEGSVVLLGSATPSVESYHRAEQGEYGLITLQDRVDSRPLPPVEIVDLRLEMQEGHKSIFSRVLLNKMGDRLARGEQVIIFLNRRGFSTFVVCRQCGLVMKCHQCAVPLTYHTSDGSLKCHYCDHREKAPETCPKCQSIYIRYFGVGTQRVEDEIKKYFPGAKVARMDVDTTSRKGSHEAILTEFEEGRADILVGTQMIAKGLDFHNVTLVGVVTADTALNLPDFRAGERTFQLLTQVAGRAGRGQKPGEVVIQTYAPDHYSIQAAKEHDYLKFYREEICNRETWGQPPFSSLIRFLLSSTSEQAVIQAANKFRDLLQEKMEDADSALEILGPAPAPISRIRKRFRWHILIKSPRREQLYNLLAEVSSEFDQISVGGVKLSIDVDPQAVL
ncbi:MAG: primosomal protein N' [Thermincolia bacterium]